MGLGDLPVGETGAADEELERDGRERERPDRARDLVEKTAPAAHQNWK